ncbi:helix-turn-helix domain-containing protein [Streptomyces sp. NPDC005374]|uniref:nSTAND1 domain-containing NTPase n=1 Tax=Streptomyces sp. NPDC005374 TaxID=3364713 RepID=UPI00369D8139
MGRREKPVDPEAGPVQRLAHDLRLLREKAGKPPYREMAEKAGYSTTALSQAAAGDQLPSLPLVRAYAQALGADPKEWEERWREADAEVRTPSAEERAPYRGLARFEPGDSDLFFGRDKQVGELLGLVRAHRFAAVFGASGSGKSSLLRAGLIPALGQSEGGDRPAVIRVLTPGERPAHTHESALTARDGELDTWVIVDQFEEVFTLCHDREERDRFLDLLLRARDRAGRLRVAIAVRGDFYGHCAAHQGLAEAVSGANLLVGPMSRDELREAITGPASAAGLNVERVLTARVIDEVAEQPGALPMLSHALLETWRRRRGRTLTLAAYEETGGVRGAIATSAEQVYGDLTPEQARSARRILLRLIAPGDGAADTRRPASRSELEPGAGDVLERLAAARLVTLDGDTVELAHEVLITGWPRLAGWIEENRERLRAHRHLGESARAWEELDRDAGALYRGTRLAQAEEFFGGGPGPGPQSPRGPWSRSSLRSGSRRQPQQEPPSRPHPHDDLAPPERAFLVASRGARDAEQVAGVQAARRTRNLTVGLAAFLVLALAAGLLAWQRNQVSEEEAAKAAARRLATVSESLRSTDPRTAALLSVAAWRLAPLTESRSALLESLARPERDAYTDPRTGDNARRFLTGQGRTLVTVTGEEVTVRNVADHRVTATYRLPGGTEASETGPDARFLVITGEGGDTLWNLTAGQSAADLAETAYWAAADDGSAYVTGPLDGPGPVRVRRTGDGKVLFGRSVPDALTDVTVGPGGRLLALCPASGAPQVWDTVHDSQLPGAWQKADGTVCGTGSGADGGSRLLRLSADGRRLAAVHGTTATVWDVSSGRTVADFTSGDATGFSDAALSPDGKFLATADGQEVAVWQMADGGGLVFRTPTAGAEVRELAWDPDSGSRTLRYLDGATVHTDSLSDRLNAPWRSTPTDATALSPDGTALATVTRSGRSYRLDLRATRGGAVLAHATLGPLPGDDRVPQPAFSPDGKALAVADTVSAHGSLRQRFTVWDVGAHRVRTSFETSGAADRAVSGLALGPGGRTLLAVRDTNGGGTVELWDTATHRRTAGPKGALYPGTLALRPDGGLLADSSDQYVKLPSGRVTGRSLADGRQITALAFSPDGTRLAVGDSTGHVTLWDGEPRTRLGILTGTSDTAAQGDAEAVNALAFSVGGATLAVGGRSGTLRLWDTAGQQQLGTDLPTAGDEIDALAFGDDDSVLYASGPNVLLQQHPVAPAHVVRVLCERFGGGLTEAQWRTYVSDAPYRRVCP